MRRLVVLLLLAVVLGGLRPSLGAAAAGDQIPFGAERATIVKALDGDTIRVSVNGKGRTVRLILIDTPETRDPNSPVECFGAEATKRLRTMLPKGRTVYLEKDVSDKDRYGRSLRYVWFKGKEDGKAYLANEIMAEEGYAALATFPPDLKYVDRIRVAVQEARDANRGLWPACGGVDTPLAVVSAPEPTPVTLISDCSAFASFAEAQAYYAANPGAAALDPNGDGRACEVYFGVDVVPTGGTTDGSGSGSAGGGGDLDCADFATWADAQGYYEANGGNNVDNLDSDYDGIACEALYPGDASSGSGGSTGGSSGGSSGGQAGFGGYDGWDYDCSDFGWDQGAATAYFLGDGGSAGNNVDGLDDNHNGIACEPGEG